ncbi:FAD-binding oxidoreductase [Mycobacterium sp. PS03-16]|uniref:FAD-binding oxidoreductase n=1 Tax=Mycobacterium sp. PS03-16 TaxID=2559611 RepID=UPI0010734727|nr:FAD-binding oxidoreductase [Mycobacterium sp. PS03-16]TFV56498.1 FAD-binding oxidoreductase [Mycobacterium sp. PS03-16]
MAGDEELAARLTALVGGAHVIADPDVLAGRCVDYTGRYRGDAALLVRPGCTAEVSAVLIACREAGRCVTVQGGRTSLVAGAVPEHRDVLLSTERLTGLGPVDTVERRIRAGAGAPLSAVQHAATAAGLEFGVDLAARDTATIGGMASTNAGGLRTVRYGNMGEQVLGLQVVLPDGAVLDRHSEVRRDNTGYDLAALFVGAEGTLGVLTELELRLHPVPAHRVTALCGFADLDAVADAGRTLRDRYGIAALELVDARAAALAAEHLDVAVPVDGDWLLLIELAADTDLTDSLADALAGAPLCGEPAVATDAAAAARLWQVREAVADVVGVFGPPLKFDVSLPLARIGGFAQQAAELVARHAADAVPVLFGHIGEGNLHLNVLRCSAQAEGEIYAAMMALIAAHGGNVSSEHGVGTRKRDYLTMSRTEADIATMRAVKAALDPDGYLNRAVLFGT